MLVPWCLIGMAIVTAGLPEPWRRLALAGQVGFYLTAIIDSFVPRGFLLKKFTSPFRTFVILMAASLFAVRIFFVSPRSLWKETTVRKTAQARAD
jgi:hypothetical protein